MSDHDPRPEQGTNLGYERLLQLDRKLGRRTLLGGGAAAAAAALLAACGGSASTPTSVRATSVPPTIEPTRASIIAPTVGTGGNPTPTAGSGAPASTGGVALPADAAAADQQVYVVNTIPDVKVVDFYESVCWPFTPSALRS